MRAFHRHKEVYRMYMSNCNDSRCQSTICRDDEDVMQEIVKEFMEQRLGIIATQSNIKVLVQFLEQFEQTYSH